MLTQTKARSGALQGGRVVFLPLSSIRPNPAQPRTVFDAQGLQELAASIRQYGVLQPLTVRKKAGFFELVAGERRLRAAGLAGLCEVPCLLVSVDDQDAGLLALVENLQRRDLDYLEQAEGLQRLMQEYTGAGGAQTRQKPAGGCEQAAAAAAIFSGARSASGKRPFRAARAGAFALRGRDRTAARHSSDRGK